MFVLLVAVYLPLFVLEFFLASSARRAITRERKERPCGAVQ